MSASGLGVFEGREAIRAAAAEMTRTGHSPVAHFLTNVVITVPGPFCWARGWIGR